MYINKITVPRIVLTCICFVAQLFLFNIGGSDKDFMSQNEYILLLSFFYILFFLLVTGKLSFINNVVTQFLGKISYSLYLMHLYPSALLISLLTRTKYFHFDFWVVIFLIVLPYLFISSYCLFKYIEVPGIKQAKRIRLAM